MERLAPVLLQKLRPPMTGKGGKGGAKGQEWPKLPGGGGEGARILAELKAQRLKLDQLAKQQKKGPDQDGNRATINKTRTAG